MRKYVPVLLVAACLSVISMRAQHVPEDQLTVTDHPEHELAGIKVYGMTLKQVIDLYGQPNSKEKDKQGLPIYIWQKSGIKLQVGTAYDNPDNVYAVDVWGTKPAGELGKTRQGLTLGSDLNDLRKIYGPKVIQHHPTEAMIAFHDDTMLTVGLDDGGRVNHISLVGAVE